MVLTYIKFDICHLICTDKKKVTNAQLTFFHKKSKTLSLSKPRCRRRSVKGNPILDIGVNACFHNYFIVQRSIVILCKRLPLDHTVQGWHLTKDFTLFSRSEGRDLDENTLSEKSTIVLKQTRLGSIFIFQRNIMRTLNIAPLGWQVFAGRIWQNLFIFCHKSELSYSQSVAVTR